MAREVSNSFHSQNTSPKSTWRRRNSPPQMHQWNIWSMDQYDDILLQSNIITYQSYHLIQMSLMSWSKTSSCFVNVQRNAVSKFQSVVTVMIWHQLIYVHLCFLSCCWLLGIYSDGSGWHVAVDVQTWNVLVMMMHTKIHLDSKFGVDHVMLLSALNFCNSTSTLVHSEIV